MGGRFCCVFVEENGGRLLPIPPRERLLRGVLRGRFGSREGEGIRTRSGGRWGGKGRDKGVGGSDRSGAGEEVG